MRTTPLHNFIKVLKITYIGPLISPLSLPSLPLKMQQRKEVRDSELISVPSSSQVSGDL